MNSTHNIIAIIGLALGAIFGIAGSNVSDPNLISSFYAISSIGIITAAGLLCIKFLRHGDDNLAIGFLLFAIAEASMNVGTAAGEIDGIPSFGAGMALYVPALCFIGCAKYFPAWVKYAGFAASVPFAYAAATIFSGGHITSSSPVVGIAYGLLVLTFIGWTITFIQEIRLQKTKQALA